MPALALALLGSFTITLDGEPVTRLESDKVRALLARLALEPERAFRRETLAALLWPEAAPARAAQSLRQALYSLRSAIGDAFLLTTPQTVQFNASADVTIDVLTWRRLWDETLQHRHRRRETCRHCLARLAEAVALYRGDLLAGFALRDCPDFDDWVAVERERLHVQALDALTWLANAAERRGDYAAAQGYVRQLLALEPWLEAAHQQRMRLLTLEGRRAAALEQFETCRRALADELGLEPTAETRALEAQIRAGAPLPAPPEAARVLPPDLPLTLTPFIGRKAELALLNAQLENPQTRLVTLTGPGGIGKTRLALQAALAQAEAFADGVYWVALTEAESEADLALGIARALHIPLAGAQEIRSQLLRALRDGRYEALLILDDFEQLLPAGGAALVLDVLRAAPRLTLLVTSRERLNLQAEVVLPLEGLAYAQTPEADSPAAQLFAARAAYARIGFAVTGEAQRAAVMEICRLVDGSPLGIELAAAWADAMAPERIAEAIAETLDFLAVACPDLPDRHRSLRAVFEGSWALLSPAEQTALMQMAVFRGGFQAEAAQQVAGVDAPTLAALVRKSLLTWDKAHARYALHNDIRYYAAEKLEAQPLLAQQTRARHATYFADLVQRHAPALRGWQQQTAQAEIERELQNALAAWQWAIGCGNAALLDRLAHGLFAFYESKSWFKEGARIFEPAVEWARGALPESGGLLRRLLGRLAVFYRQLGQYAQAARLVEEGLAAPGPLSDEDEAFLRYQMAWLTFLRGQYAEARAWAETALERYRTLGQAIGSGDCLSMLGWTAYELGEMDAAADLCRQAEALCEEAGYAWGVQYAVYGLGLVARVRGDYAAARRCFLQNLEFCEQIGYPWGSAQAHINLGVVALAQGEVPTAEACFRQSLALCERMDNLWGIAQSYKGLGEAALARGDLPAAQAWAQRSLERYRQMQDQDGMADNLLLLSQAAQESGDLPAARRHLEQAAACIRATENGFRAARVWHRQALILLEEGEAAQAQALLEQTMRHPACEHAIRVRAEAALRGLMLAAAGQ